MRGRGSWRHVATASWLVAVSGTMACQTNEGVGMRQPVLTDKAPQPVGPYSQAIIDSGFIFLAGQGPANAAAGTMELSDVKAATRQTFENIRAILEAAGASMDDVVKCNVYLRDINDFAAMNEVYASVFQAPFPARTTIQAGALPGGIPVEIECVARKP